MDGAAESCEFSSDKQALAVMGRVCGIECVHREARNDFAGYDSVECVRPSDSTEVQVVKQELGSVADRHQR